MTFIGAGKLGLPENAVVAFALGRRHGQRRPRGDARRSAASRRRGATPTTARPAWPPRTRGWCAASTPTLKSVRARELRRAACAATCSRSPRRWACAHPALITPDDVDVLDGVRSPAVARASSTATPPGDGELGAPWRDELAALMAGELPAEPRPRRPLSAAGLRTASAGRTVLPCAGRTSASSLEEAVGPGRDVVLRRPSCASPASGGSGPSASARSAPRAARPSCR